MLFESKYFVSFEYILNAWVSALTPVPGLVTQSTENPSFNYKLTHISHKLQWDTINYFKNIKLHFVHFWYLESCSLSFILKFFE